MVSRRAESEARASRSRGKMAGAGLREGTGKIICLRFLLKEANDELLRISRGSLFHVEGAAKLKPRLSIGA